MNSFTRVHWRRAWLFALLVMQGGGCLDAFPVQCRDAETTCRRELELPVGSICIFDGVYGTFCAVQDRECATGYRWSEYEYRELAGKCMEPSRLGADGGLDS